MLAQLLKRDFMLKSMETLKAGIQEQTEQYHEGNRAIIKFLNDREVTLEDLQRARTELVAAIERDGKRQSDAADNVAFFPRDPVISLAQSALQEFCDVTQKTKTVSSEGRGAAGAQNIPVTNFYMDDALATLLTGPAPQRGLWQQYELLDIGWANCLTAIGLRKFFKRHPFNEEPAVPVKVGNNARVVLVSDWGSGLPRALKVSDAIRESLADPKAASRDKHVIHLGDVYYSGLAREYENNFLNCWPVQRHEKDRISSWILNANHDMYSGGWGYFDYVLRDDSRFKKQKDKNGTPSSFFSLENDHWLILGLDTGYHENLLFDAHDLYGGQAAWVTSTLANAPDKNGILLSHHQPFSSFSGKTKGEKLLKKLEVPLRAGRVRAWFWGHEHRCALYQPRENVEYPRCIGHGGIPFYMSTQKAPLGVSYEYQQGFRDLIEKWNYFGFLVMDFEDTNIHVSYVNERGETHHQETISKK